MNYIFRLLKLIVFRHQWRKRNSHNNTTVAKCFEASRVSVGQETYGKINVDIYDKGDDEVLKIGSYCSIASGVRFLCGGDHNLNHLLTFPVSKRYRGVDEAITKGKIIVEDDVWLGTNALILSGVTIGQGSVVAAGSVVTKNVPAYAIVAGVPAKVIKYRFDDSIIEKLLTIKIENLKPDQIKKNIELFETDIKKENIDTILSVVSEKC